MMKTISKQFVQLATSNGENVVFPNQMVVKLKGGSSSSFDPNDVCKVNVVISLLM